MIVGDRGFLTASDSVEEGAATLEQSLGVPGALGCAICVLVLLRRSVLDVVSDSDEGVNCGVGSLRLLVGSYVQ